MSVCVCVCVCVCASIADLSIKTELAPDLRMSVLKTLITFLIYIRSVTSSNVVALSQMCFFLGEYILAQIPVIFCVNNSE